MKKGKQHSFDIEEAEKYGIKEAILLANIRHWLDKNKANKTNIHDGRVWTYNSYKAFAELFPYMTVKQIRTTLNKLTGSGILITGNYNKAGYDKTLWYTIDEPEYVANGDDQTGESKSPEGQVHVPKRADPFAHTGTPIPYSKPYSKPDVNTNKRRSVFVEKAKQLQDTVDLWNETYGTDVRITDKKRQQLNARLKNFTIEEIHKAIRNRAENEWLKGDGHAHRGNWDSLFRNDERVEKYLNAEKPKQETTKPFYGYNMPREYYR